MVLKKYAKRYSRSVRQTGRTNLKIDRKRRALPVGRRVSKSGNVYFEYRKNRSDIAGYDFPLKRKSIKSLTRKSVRKTQVRRIDFDSYVKRTADSSKEIIKLLDYADSGDYRLVLFKADGRSSIRKVIEPTIKSLSSKVGFPVGVKRAKYMASYLGADDFYNALERIAPSSMLSSRISDIRRDYVLPLDTRDRIRFRNFLRMNAEMRQLKKTGYYVVQLVKKYY